MRKSHPVNAWRVPIHKKSSYGSRPGNQQGRGQEGKEGERNRERERQSQSQHVPSSFPVRLDMSANSVSDSIRSGANDAAIMRSHITGLLKARCRLRLQEFSGLNGAMGQGFCRQPKVLAKGSRTKEPVEAWLLPGRWPALAGEGRMQGCGTCLRGST